MSLSGALNSAVSGLNAQASALAMISTNLANASTVGYKAITASFSTMLNGGSGTAGAVGGVKVQGLTNVAAQGLPTPSTITTNMAIQGSGFFVVSSGPTTSDFMYTRNGEFNINPNGFLQNTANGQYLKGWPTDTDGNILGGTSFGSLTTVSINDFSTIAGATSTLSLEANLPANASGPVNKPPVAASLTGSSNAGVTINPTVVTPAVAASITGTGWANVVLAAPSGFQLSDGVNSVTIALPAGTYTAAALQSAINTQASTAVPAVTVNATVVGGELVLTHATAGANTISVGTFTGDLTGFADLHLPAAASTNGAAAVMGPSTFTITDTGGLTTTVSLPAGAYTLAQIATAINTASLSAMPGPTDMGIFADVNPSGALTITSDTAGERTLTVGGFTGSLASTGLSQLGLPAAASTNGADAVTVPADSFPSTIEVFDSLGTPATIKITWTKSATPNEWLATFDDPVSSKAATAGSIGTVSIGSAMPATKQVVVTFNSDGTLATPSTLQDLNIAWASGAEPSAIKTNFGTPGQQDGLTQFALNSDELSVSMKYDQNGVDYGSLSSVYLSKDGGVMIARYDNGRERSIFRVPVATVTNPNGLDQSSGGLYASSSESGPVTLGIAGQDGSGEISGASLEMSTTDTNKEFANMMAAQQAYSGSAQVMTAANDMFDTLIGAVR